MTGYRVVRLQVQRRPMKVGRAPLRRYDPAALVPVTSLRVGPSGVHGVTSDGREVLDVHHQHHPESRDRKGRAGILFLGTGDYLALRARYGEHLVDGIAGETVLLDAPEGFAGRHVPAGVTVSTALGALELHDVRAADPCVEFSRFCLAQEPSAVVDDAVRQALIDLDGGSRGYRSVAASSGTIALGDVISF